jgi:tetratricopeptide (TPR) repeat protein
MLAAKAASSLGERLAFSGYSVQAPLSRGWQRTPPGGDFDVAFQAAKSSTHTMSITAAATPFTIRFATPEEFLNYMRRYLAAEPDRKRFSAVEVSVTLEPSLGPLCVRARTKSHDHKAANRVGKYLVLEIWNVTCVHPAAPELVVSLAYHERYQPGEKPGDAESDGERFISSLRFEAPDPAIKLRVAAALVGQENRPQEAEKLIREASEIYEARQEVIGLANAYSAYGSFFSSKAVEASKDHRENGFLDDSARFDSRYAKSIEYFDKAASIFLAQKRFDALTNVNLNKAFTYAQMGDHKAACAAFEESLASARSNLEQNPSARPVIPPGYTSIEDYLTQEKRRHRC